MTYDLRQGVIGKEEFNGLSPHYYSKKGYASKVRLLGDFEATQSIIIRLL